MNYKVDLSEVTALSDKISRVQKKVETDLNVVNDGIETLNALDSFKGKSAEISKYYFSEFHQTIIDSIKQLFIELDADMVKNIDNFLNSIDHSDQAKTSRNYLEQQKEDIESAYTKFELLSQNIHRTLDSVSDIVYVSKPTFYDIGTKKNILIRIIDDLIINMGRFNHQNENNKLSDTLDKIELLLKNTEYAEEGKKFTEFYKGQSKRIRMELMQWVDSKQENSPGESLYKYGKPAQKIFSKYIGRMEKFLPGSATMAYLLKNIDKERRN